MNRLVKSLCAFCLFAIVAYGDDAEKLLQERAKIVRKRTSEAITNLQAAEKEQAAWLGRVKKGVIRPGRQAVVIPSLVRQPIEYPSKAAKTDARESAESDLKNTKARIERMKAGTEFSYGVLTVPLKVGDFGRLEDPNVIVRQVLGNTIFIEATYSVSYPDVVGETLITRHRFETLPLLVQGVPTKNVTTDAGFKIPHVLHVRETETVPTVIGGSRTMFVVEPLDVAELEKVLRSE